MNDVYNTKGIKMKKFAILLIMFALMSGVVFGAGEFKSAGATTDAKAAAKVEKAPAAAEKAAGEVVEKVAEGEVVLDENGNPVEGEKKKPQSPFDSKMLLILGGVMVLMFWFSSRAKKKQQQQRSKLLDSLSKGDKVVTIGGICGTIIEAGETEIVVKVGENNRMKFARWAVRAAGEDAEMDKKKENKDEE